MQLFLYKNLFIYHYDIESDINEKDNSNYNMFCNWRISL